MAAFGGEEAALAALQVAMEDGNDLEIIRISDLLDKARALKAEIAAAANKGEFATMSRLAAERQALWSQGVAAAVCF